MRLGLYFHIIWYISELSIYMDPSLTVIDYSDFKTNPQDFAENYRDVKE